MLYTLTRSHNWGGICWCRVFSEEKEEKDYSDNDSDSGSPVEVRPKKIPSLKIRLPMVAVRKSLREKKQAQVMTVSLGG